MNLTSPSTSPATPLVSASGRAIRRFLSFAVISIGLLTTLSCFSAVAAELPDIGDASATTFSPEQESRLGRLIMRDKRRQQEIIDDPFISQYIQSLGNQLSANTTNTQQPFTFFVANDNTINAYALPGGYIGVHAGLILASESEDELASVLAHEISHVTQHHIARSYDKAKEMNLPVTAAIIAAILLGAHDPQAGMAAYAATVAGSSQMQLDFTRANEQEADRVGIQLLAQAGYDPRGMAEFFSRLQKETRYYGSGLPEFLRTHPVTTSRIAEAEDRASHYPRISRPDSENYHAVKALLRVRQSSDLNDLVERTANNIKTGHYRNLGEEQFTHALALQALGQYKQACTELQQLLKKAPGRIAYMQSLAECQIKAGRQQVALTLYQKGLDLYPGNTILTLGYSTALLNAGQAASADKLLQKFTRDHPDSMKGFQLLAEAEAATGNQAASHLAYAEYYALQSEYHSAIDQLDLALKQRTNDFYLTSRIEARLKQLKQEKQQLNLDAME